MHGVGVSDGTSVPCPPCSGSRCRSLGKQQCPGLQATRGTKAASPPGRGFRWPKGVPTEAVAGRELGQGGHP